MLRIKNNIRIWMIGLSFIICHLSFIPIRAQIGTWRNYLAYYEIQQICSAGDDIFVRASNNLYKYNQKDQSIYTYDKVNGLSDTNIAFIAWNKQSKRLIAAYKNSNIDIIDTNGNITNIPSLFSKTMTEDKTVNYIFNNGIYAFLATGFGVLKVNMSKIEISETYILDYNIISLDVRDDYIYALAEKDDQRIVLNGNLSDNLMEKSNWHIVDPSEYPAYIFEKDNEDWNTYYPIISTLNPDGPKYNHFGFLKYANDRLYTCGGHSSSITIPGCIQILNNNEWDIYEDETIPGITGINYVNVACIDYDPSDNTHLFAASRTGLYEFRNGKFIQLYNDENSPIESFNGKNKNYEMVTGLKYDQNGTLWCLNSQAPTQSLIEYTIDGKFISHNIPDVMKLDAEGYKSKSLGNLSNAIFDSNGKLWFVNNNWYMASAYRYDTQNKTTNTYINFVNQDGTAITGMYAVTCAVEDREGNMWLGTDAGPFLLEKSQIDADKPYYTQVKVPRNDGTNYADYLLSKVSITSICIDAGNRKWIGTEEDGVYLISADNLSQIYHFTTENSKLLSNTIKSIAINNNTGEVFFGTENGLCSFMSDATTIYDEMTEDNIWAYPNPVTPEYTGLITVVGLSYNADVKILSSNGTLISEGRSNGGSFTWDGNDKNGKKVVSGVYMVVTATSDGKKGTVCKIAVIR